MSSNPDDNQHPVRSPDSDISPKTPIPPSSSAQEYFFSKPLRAAKTGDPSSAGGKAESRPVAHASANPRGSVDSNGDVAESGTVVIDKRPAALDTEKGPEPSEPQSSRKSEDAHGRSGEPRRKSSTASLTIRPPRNLSLPQGTKKRYDSERIRAASPPHRRFQAQVAFASFDSAEPTKSNTVGLTLQSRHKAFQLSKLSRTFMVGLDEHDYSQNALQWLLDTLVEDGDIVVCIRVNEKDVKVGHETQYLSEAKQVVSIVEESNNLNKGIQIILEYSFGKLAATFNSMIHVYQPGMLIVGTRGKGQGLQGVLSTHNSFSKYCLQYSPVPVVVVRPSEKRVKKKAKRSHDPGRQTYAQMLAVNGGKHEIHLDTTTMFELLPQNSADEEAHQVAKALGLPAKFDPTIKGININASHRSRPSAGKILSPELAVAPRATGHHVRVAPAPNDSGDEDDDDDEDTVEFGGGPSSHRASQQSQRFRGHRLDQMEVGEGAALRRNVENLDDDE